MKRNSQNWVQVLATIQSPPPRPPQKKYNNNNTNNNNNSFRQQWPKLPQKQISKFSGLVQFCFIFLLFANHIIALNSSQFPSNLNILTFLITSKPLSNIYRKYKQGNLRERFKSKSFLQTLFCMFALGQKWISETFNCSWRGFQLSTAKTFNCSWKGFLIEFYVYS